MGGLKVGMWDLLMRMGMIPLFRAWLVFCVFWEGWGRGMGGMGDWVQGWAFALDGLDGTNCRMFYITDRVKELIKYKGPPTPPPPVPPVPTH